MEKILYDEPQIIYKMRCLVCGSLMNQLNMKAHLKTNKHLTVQKVLNENNIKTMPFDSQRRYYKPIDTIDPNVNIFD